MRRFASATSRRSFGPRASSSATDWSTSPSAEPSTPRWRSASSLPSFPRLIELGREIKRELEAWQDIVHPLEPELRDVYGVIFWQEEGEIPLTQRNVTVFADGEVDRSPCGSGTSARLALLDRAGRLPRGAELRHVSIVGTEFRARVVGDERGRRHPGCRHRGRGERVPDRRARLHARPARSARRRFPAALGRQQPDDLAVLWEAALRLLREDEVAVDQDVELRPRARSCDSPRSRAPRRSRPRDSRPVCRTRFRWGSRRSRWSRRATLVGTRRTHRAVSPYSRVAQGPTPPMRSTPMRMTWPGGGSSMGGNRTSGPR